MHCHLLAGLDDGPRTPDDALAMCRICHEEGVQMVAATAHQNQRWSAVTPAIIREATSELKGRLENAAIPLSVFANAEVMAAPETLRDWHGGRLLSIADRRQFMLVEMPRGMFVDLTPMAQDLQRDGIRLLLAHPEQQEEFLESPELLEELVRLGCLVQMSTGNVTKAAGTRAEKTLKDWFRRGLVHVMGSDGHSPRRRQPRMRDAYQQVATWAGPAVADRVFNTNAMAILQGLSLRPVPPRPRRKFWLLPF
jgi:protein-tyrosine phosphatase